MKKRSNYISWDRMFMSIAMIAAARSKDPSTQVGACVVSKDNRCHAIGYNGLPVGCSDDKFPWAREGGFLERKYPFVVHAELNAILNARFPLDGCRIYTTMFPCNECAKAIIQAGIEALIFLDDKYHDKPEWVASRMLLSSAMVNCRQFLEKQDLTILI